MHELPGHVEEYRDRNGGAKNRCGSKPPPRSKRWSRSLAFASGSRTCGKNLPSVYIAVCGRRDAHMPRNVQKDYEASKAWVLKGRGYRPRQGLLRKARQRANSMFVAPRMVPIFQRDLGRCKKRRESKRPIGKTRTRSLKGACGRNGTWRSSDLREETGIRGEKRSTKAMDKLQRTMKVVPQEVLYVPKFTYIWTLAEGRFPKELSKKISRVEAVRELARCYLEMCGLTLLGDLSRTFGFARWESGRANHQLFDEGSADRLGRRSISRTAVINCISPPARWIEPARKKGRTQLRSASLTWGILPYCDLSISSIPGPPSRHPRTAAG